MKSFILALSMFTKIPVKNNYWEERAGASALSFLPVIGLLAGGATAIIYHFAKGAVSPVLCAAVVVLSYFLVCGFLHMDGFMDVCDAVMSSRSNEQKAEILKDSRVGAFSVISVVLLVMMLYASAYSLLTLKASAFVFLLIPFMSRSLSVLFAFSFRPMSEKGLLVFFKGGLKPAHIVLCLFFLSAGFLAAYFTAGFRLLISAIISTAALILFILYANKVFKGINGDMIGFTIVAYEAFAYFIYAVFL